MTFWALCCRVVCPASFRASPAKGLLAGRARASLRERIVLIQNRREQICRFKCFQSNREWAFTKLGFVDANAVWCWEVVPLSKYGTFLWLLEYIATRFDLKWLRRVEIGIH